MRILLHDYSGHPFQAQLSRSLAARGHDVEHVSCHAYVSGKGDLELRPSDPRTLTFCSLGMGGGDFAKYDARQRLLQERSYAKVFITHLEQANPDVVVMCNTPLLAHALIARWCRRKRLPMVFWQQDVYSQAWGQELRRRLGRVGSIPASALDRLEGWIARASEQVVVIARTFLPVHRRWRTPPDRLTVLPNWAPLAELPTRPRTNAWARDQDLHQSVVLLYSGTLGLKHNPQLLLDLASALSPRVPGFRLVVVSEGAGADYIREHAGAAPVTVLPFQPFEVLPDVLASGDVLIVILEPHAGEYSVPSKTLSYLCAARAVVALLPATNPAFETVQNAGGLAYDLATLDASTVAEDVAGLLLDEEARVKRGQAARRYAEHAFDIERISAEFDAVLERATSSRLDVDKHARV